MLKAKQIQFIDEYLKDADHIRAYRIVFKSKTDKIAASAGKRFLKRPEIAQEILKRQAEKEAIVQEARKEALTDQAKEGLLSDLELELILCDLAGGDIEIEETVMEKGKPRIIYRGATPFERISAIEKLYKKRGSNAPAKHEIKSEDHKVEIIRTIIIKEKGNGVKSASKTPKS